MLYYTKFLFKRQYFTAFRHYNFISFLYSVVPIDFVLFSAVENDKIINIISLVNSDHHVKRSETSYASRSL